MADKKQEQQAVKEQLNSILEEVETEQDKEISPKLRKLAEEAIVKIMVEHKTPKEALGFTPPMLEYIYRYAYNLFKAGKYKEALPVFTFLRQMDIVDARYSLAIASCHHYLKNYNQAILDYFLCKYLEPYNPLYCLYLYDCFMQIDDPLSAARALLEGIELAKLDPDYDLLKEKALLEYNYLEKYLKEYLPKKFEPSTEKV